MGSCYSFPLVTGNYKGSDKKPHGVGQPVVASEVVCVMSWKSRVLEDTTKADKKPEIANVLYLTLVLIISQSKLIQLKKPPKNALCIVTHLIGFILILGRK